VNNLDTDQKNYILDTLNKMNEVLNVFRLQGCPLAPDVNALIQRREQARARKDWQAADEAREELARKGIVIIDTVNGPVWKRARDVE
jgi:cysteinyl-tRNA synthetase